MAKAPAWALKTEMVQQVLNEVDYQMVLALVEVDWRLTERLSQASADRSGSVPPAHLTPDRAFMIG